MHLRERLKLQMAQQGISLRQLSLESGVRRQSISTFFDGGNLHLDNLDKLISALGMKLTLLSLNDLAQKKARQQLQKHLDVDRNKIKKFCQKYSIRSLAFFGSVLRDDFRKESDIDVLVDFEKPLTFFELANVEVELQKLLKSSHALHLVTLPSLSPVLADEILSQLEIVYEQAA